MKSVDDLVEFAAAVEGQGLADNQNCTYTRPELQVLARHVAELPKQAMIVEIGVFAGRTASLFFQLHPEMEFDIHLIDNWSWNQTFAAAQFNKLILEHFNEVPFTLHKMRSDYLGPRWSGDINFLHIDGWHDMPGIEPDCQLWLPWVLPGGVAAFHDSDCPPVTHCIDEYVRSRGWLLIGEAGRTTVWRKPLV